MLDDVEIYGYSRPQQSVRGLRNHLIVVSITDLTNSIAFEVASSVERAFVLVSPFGRVADPVRKRAGLAAQLQICLNPNVGAVMLVGLDAETLAYARSELADFVDVAIIDVSRGTNASCRDGVSTARELLSVLASRNREPIELSALCVGIKSVGSTSASSSLVTPVLGRFVDVIVEAGGRVLFDECADLVRVVAALEQRASNSSVRGRIAEVMQRYVELERDMGPGYPNPTAHNRENGVVDLEGKGSAALLRLGRHVIQSVISYGERPMEPGLHMVTGAASPVASALGLVASGCNVIVCSLGDSVGLYSFIAPVINICPIDLHAQTDDGDLYVESSESNASLLLELLAACT